MRTNFYYITFFFFWFNLIDFCFFRVDIYRDQNTTNTNKDKNY